MGLYNLDTRERDSQEGQHTDLPVLGDSIPHSNAPRVTCGNELVPHEE